MPNVVSLLVESSKLIGWKTISISRSMDTLCSSFDFSMVDVWEGDPVELVPNLPCSVSIDDTKMVTGYIDSVKIRTGRDSHIIQVHGRDKTADLVDCSAANIPGSWKNVDVIRFFSDLIRPFGLAVTSNTSLGEKIKDYTLASGEAPFEAIQKICKDRAFVALSDSEGDLYITNSGNLTATDKLIYGQNIISADVEYDFVNRYSLYKVKGQKSGSGDSWGNSTTEIYGEATDDAIDRYRPLVITADGQITNSLANKRASWEAQTRAGRSGKLSVTIPTWRQSNGDLWDVNLLVSCDLPPFRITPDQKLLINEIEYKQDDSAGTTCTMKLIRSDAYSPEPPKEVKTPAKRKQYAFGW